MREKLRSRSFENNQLPEGCHLADRLFQLVFIFPLVCLSGLFLGGCVLETYAPETAPEYVIIRDATGFYRLGPEQGHGPDVLLAVQTRVKMLRREMGFSLVQLEDTKTGYVANENMAVAPPRPAQPIQSAAANSGSDSRKNGGKSRGKAYSGAQVNDTPLPNFESPLPDLKIQPEVVPDTIRGPSEGASSSPKFRY